MFILFGSAKYTWVKLMDVIAGDLGPYGRIAKQYRWVYANSKELKAKAYRMRSAQPALHIDAFDAVAHQYLMQHKDSGEFIAASRVVARDDLPPGVSLPVEEQIGSAFTPALREEGSLVCSEMMPCHYRDDLLARLQEDEDLLCLSLALGASALAGLLFHDYLLVALPIRRFKQFRAQGMRFEYAGELASFDREVANFYLDLRVGIKPGNPLNALQQLVAEQFAPFVNMPTLQETENI